MTFDGRDGSVALARASGARVLEIAPERFSHGGTRNLLVEQAGGAHVALLTQDAVPADERWLERVDAQLTGNSWDKTFEGMRKEIERIAPLVPAQSADVQQ